MNFQVTVLKILSSYPGGFATMADIKRDMAILATSGRDWAERTKRLATRIPGLDIFSQGFVERESGGWRITEKGQAALELMEPRDRHAPTMENTAAGPEEPPATRLQLPDERARRRRQRREKRRLARDRARAS